mmetsp:Transcript_2263/g.4294  ORF Transcript_2263/g.4294 Transcript_2263/m.4294 type:complete len:83 (-) Transcript_2263:52-300(-)
MGCLGQAWATGLCGAPRMPDVAEGAEYHCRGNDCIGIPAPADAAMMSNETALMHKHTPNRHQPRVTTARRTKDMALDTGCVT